MTTREVLHINSNKILQVNNESIVNNFQELTIPELINLGYIVVGDYYLPFNKNTDQLFIIEEKFNNGEYSDFKQAREYMRAEALQIGYSNLVIQQIELLTKWRAIPSEVSEQYYDIWTINKLTKFFDDNSQVSRSQRKDCVIRFLRNAIPNDQLFPIINKVQPLLDNYLVYGIEGIGVYNINGVEDPVGIYNYINSTEGTVFENTGFAEEIITPNSDLSITEIKQKIMGVFENGIYI